VIARLIARGLVREAAAKSAPAHPGLARRYYALTAAGRSTLASEAERLKAAAALAVKRLGTV
jgi:DNA-binding PadR family transcriptional regulator